MVEAPPRGGKRPGGEAPSRDSGSSGKQSGSLKHFSAVDQVRVVVRRARILRCEDDTTHIHLVHV